MEKSDYTDPICPSDLSMWQKGASVTPIPVDRVIEKEDEYFGRKDYAAAERHLLYWLEEAKAGNDVRGAFTVENELMGFYRKTDREQDAFEHAEKAIALSHHELIGEGSIAQATAFLNAATVHKAFCRPEEALQLYEKTRTIYEKEIKPGDGRLGGLYNNMALALADVGRYDEAVALYRKAIDWMGRVERGALEQAMSYLNLCDALMARDARLVNEQNEPCTPDTPGASYLVPEETNEEIENDLDLAWDALNDPTLPADGYYAYVAEICAKIFKDYGRESMGIALERMAEEIHEGT